MNKEEHGKILDFVNSDDYMLLNSYISKPYEETIVEQDREIKRLNSIINELEKSILQKLEFYKNDKDYFIDEKTMEDLYIELKELKEGK